MIKLQTITVGASGASSIDFTNIPQTFTDLKVVLSGRVTSQVSNTMIRFNGTTTGYTGRQIYGTGASAASSSLTNDNIGPLVNDSAFTASVFSNGEFYIPNYTSSNYKSYSIEGVSENNATTAYQNIQAGLWSDTAAINQITIITSGNSSTFAQYTTATLYGIIADPTRKAAGGSYIYSDSNYWYHVYTTVGASSFTPFQPLTVDYLVVGGGGGGGAGSSGANCGNGAGGGGGLLTGTMSLGLQTYTATVGAGGTGGSSNSGASGTAGGSSTFYSAVAAGGGLGGGTGVAGGAGGSGGGAGADGRTGGAASQGYAGGGSSVQNQAGGGGGGMSSAGTASSGTTPGVGGNGIANSITGTSITYAGGGGGGTAATTGGAAGTGGAGAGGGNGINGTAGTANTGGGGGGGGRAAAGGNGGSGIIIVRYAK